MKVGRNWAPDGLEVTAAVRETVPVNPPVGVKVTVETLSVVAPGSRETVLPVIAKPGAAGFVTVTELDPVLLL